MNRLRPRRENDDILRSPASELMESGHLSVPSSPLLSPTAAMLTRTGVNSGQSSSAAAAGRRRAHTFDNHLPTTSSFPTTSQFAAPQESGQQHQPSSLPSASRFFGQPPPSTEATTTTTLFHNPPATGNNSSSSAAQQLAKAHQVLREEIESLTKQITESNDAYVRREEELCARLSEEQRKLEEMVRRKPTPEELTELDARGQYVTKLREEIEAKAHQLRSHEHSDFLTNTIADRVMGHIHFVESLAETLSHAIEPVKALSTSFKASLSIASQNEPPSSSSLPKEAETDDDSSLSAHILSSVEGVTAEQVHATKEACPSTAHCFVQVSRLRHFTEGLSDLLIEEGGHLADRFRQLEEAHIAARRTMNQQTEMLSEAQSALARLLDDMDEWKQRAEEKAKRLQALELERKTKAESQHPQSYSSGGGAAYGPNASSRNNSIGVSDAELESRNEELRHQIQLLTADCYREDERLASLHAEVSSLKHKEDTERKAVAEATEMLAQRRAQTKTMEKEKSDCLLKLAVAEEGKANGERQLARLQTDLEDAMEEITRQSGRLKAAELQLEETVIVHRHARRELEASRTQATAAQGRLAVRQAEVTNLAQSLEQKRAERGKLRNESLAMQTKLVELRRKVHDQLDEVQYITCLLPKNHPAGQGSKKLWMRLQAFDATSHPTASTDDKEEDEDEERKRSQAEQKAAEEYDAMLSERTERAREMRSTLLDSAKKAERERKEQQEMEHRRASAHAPVTTGSVSPTHSPSSLRPLSPPTMRSGGTTRLFYDGADGGGAGLPPSHHSSRSVSPSTSMVGQWTEPARRLREEVQAFGQRAGLIPPSSSGQRTGSPPHPAAVPPPPAAMQSQQGAAFVSRLGHRLAQQQQQQQQPLQQAPTPAASPGQMSLGTSANSAQWDAYLESAIQPQLPAHVELQRPTAAAAAPMPPPQLEHTQRGEGSAGENGALFGGGGVPLPASASSYMDYQPQYQQQYQQQQQQQHYPYQHPPPQVGGPQPYWNGRSASGASTQFSEAPTSTTVTDTQASTSSSIAEINRKLAAIMNRRSTQPLMSR